MIKVLIAEDEVDIRETIAEILEDEGFMVIQAENGKLAFEAFESSGVDIVVSDIMMPEIDGYELLNLIRKSKNRNSSVPFIFLSALSQKENIIKGTELTANDYLVKPIDFEILVAKIKEKTTNAQKIKLEHEHGITNIKNQISSALPAELTNNIASLSIIVQNLLNEPYGPLPHRKYHEDLLKVNKTIKKLNNSINNHLDSDIIDKKLNSYEEVIDIIKFFKSSVSRLPENLINRVTFIEPYDNNSFPKVKIEKQSIIYILKTVIASAIKSSTSSQIEISTIMDSKRRIVLIFYIKGDVNIDILEKYINKKDLEANVNQAGCEFDYNFNHQYNNNITITIPNFKLIS